MGIPIYSDAIWSLRHIHHLEPHDKHTRSGVTLTKIPIEHKTKNLDQPPFVFWFIKALYKLNYIRWSDLQRFQLRNPTHQSRWLNNTLINITHNVDLVLQELSPYSPMEFSSWYMGNAITITMRKDLKFSMKFILGQYQSIQGYLA